MGRADNTVTNEKRRMSANKGGRMVEGTRNMELFYQTDPSAHRLNGYRDSGFEESLFGIQFNEILVSKLKFILVNGPKEQAKYAAEFFARHLTDREDGIFQLVLQVYTQILKKPIKLAFMDQNLLSSVVVGHFAKLVLPHHYETLDSLIDISIKQITLHLGSPLPNNLKQLDIVGWYEVDEIPPITCYMVS
ncbi:unnamed protein product, partial [Timema podura]|nr:unnamed protein product [Timema podura]